MNLPAFSISIETANLSLADLDGLRMTLESLSAQTVSLARANEVLITDSGDVPDDVMQELLKAYPMVRALRLPQGTGYEDLKRAGADAATGEVIVFADGDCHYDPAWLESLLTPFADPAVAIVGGETSVDPSGPYGLAMAVTFSFTAASSPGLYRTGRYHLNNVAFRRSVLQRVPLPTRLPCYRMTGLHFARLEAAGYAIWRQPKARARHAAPNGLTHFIWRFLLFGHDGVVVPRLVAQEARETGQPPRQARHTTALAWLWFSNGVRKLVAEIRRKPARVVELVLVVPIVISAVALQTVGAVAGLVAPTWLLTSAPEDILRSSTCQPGPVVGRVAAH